MAITSFKRCETKITELPAAFKSSIFLNSFSISVSLKTEVGSSNNMSVPFFLYSCTILKTLSISTICRAAKSNAEIFTVGSMFSSLKILLASAYSAFQFIRPNLLYFFSRPRKMFCPAVRFFINDCS